MADTWFSRSIERLGFVPTASEGPQEVRATTVPTAPARPNISSVSVDTALGIGAVYRSVFILVASVAQMEMGVYRAGKEISTPALVKNPNVNDTASGFVQETVWSLACYGNAYWRLYRRDANSPVESIKVMDPKEVTWVEDPDTGKVDYWYEGKRLQPHQVKHLKLMRRPGQVSGLGPIQAAQSELIAFVYLRNFADQWFDISGVPTGTLTTDMVLGAEESAAFAEAWKEFLRTHGGTAVLSQGLKYEPLSVKPAEAQFLEVYQNAVVNIARLFGVPSTYLLAEIGGTSNTYVNQQEINLIFLQTTLTRYMTEIEDALSSLLPRGQKVEFKEEGILRMSLELKTKIQKTQVESGLRSINEVRAADFLDPLPWGDEMPKKAPQDGPGRPEGGENE